MALKPIRKAIFPVGGLGTRFLPATKALPKEMLPILDRPLIQYAVDEARAAGIEQFIFITGRGKESIESHFDHHPELFATLERRNKEKELRLLEESVMQPGQVVFIRQQEPLGLGHAVWCARHVIGDEPVAILLADDLIHGVKPCLEQMVETYHQKGGNIIAVMDVPPEKTSSYGVIKPGQIDDQLVEIKGLVEKPKPADAPSNWAVIGRYILQPEIFEHLAVGQKGAGGEIQLTDAMAQMLSYSAFHGLRFEGERFDCGSVEGYLEASLAIALGRQDLSAHAKIIIEKYAARQSSFKRQIA